MKIERKLTLLFYLIVTVLLILPGSCKKEDENAFYRIKTKDYYENDTLRISSLFLYNNDKIATERSYYYDVEDSVNTTYLYPDANTVTKESKLFYAGSWYLFYKWNIGFEDEKIKTTTSYFLENSFWTGMEKRDYTYSGEDLTEETWYQYEYGNWNPYWKISYSTAVETTSAQHFEYDNDWVLVGREASNYKGTQTDQILVQFCTGDTCQDTYKYMFSYSGNKLSRIDLYFNFDVYWDTVGYETFTYDSHGNLVEDIYHDQASTTRIQYKYEKGEGNYDQLVSPGNGLLYYGSFPGPTKKGKDALNPNKDIDRLLRLQKF